jgi:hypothetical protein
MFDLPEPMPADKVLSAGTMAVYKSRLNSLANANPKWSNVAGLKKYSKSVIKHINGMADTSDKGRLTKRGMLQAIFSVMDAKYRKRKNAYYTYFQTVLPSSTTEGVDWVKKKEFVASDNT